MVSLPVRAQYAVSLHCCTGTEDYVESLDADGIKKSEEKEAEKEGDHGQSEKTKNSKQKKKKNKEKEKNKENEQPKKPRKRKAVQPTKVFQLHNLFFTVPFIVFLLLGQT